MIRSKFEVVLRVGGVEYEVTLDVRDGDLSVAGLLAEIGVAGPLVVDGMPADSGSPLLGCGVHRGSILELGGGPTRAPVISLVGVAGRVTGRRLDLPPGAYDALAGPWCELTAHAGLVVDASGRLDVLPVVTPVSVDQAAAEAGSTVEARSTIAWDGGTAAVIRRPAQSSTTSGGAVVFNRPPRAEFPAEVPPLRLPDEQPSSPPRPRFGWAAFAAPVVLGLVLALAYGPMMAIVALVGPVVAVAGWVEDRRRSARETAQARRAVDGGLALFRERLVEAASATIRSRVRASPGPEAVVTAVVRRDPRLWERRPWHDDFLELGIGTGCVPWRPPLGNASPSAAVADLVEELSALHDAPVVVSLRRETVVGVAGPRRRALGMVRFVIVQAAALHGPCDLGIVIATDRPGDWDWLKWLPHLSVAGGLRAVVTEPGDALAVLHPLVVADDEGPSRRTTLVVVDVGDASSPEHTILRDVLAASSAGRLCGIAIADAVSSLPSACAAIVEVDETGSAVLRIPSRGERVTGVDTWYYSTSTARACARSLGELADPDSRTSTDVPDRVDLLDLLGIETPTADEIGSRWASRDSADAVPIGAGREGVVVVDVVRDGPHGLLAGTTGSGKSELLRSLVASLAVCHGPDDLNFVLVDYKGGSAFDACAALPHTVGMVTDLDGHLAQRALTCLEAELLYREQRLREAGAGDIDAFHALDREEALPRLLVVIDEFAALAKELPDFMAALVDVAQRGRSLGVHLLLATQRPGGVVSDSIRANTNLRISLRVHDGADSADVIGIPDAAAIGRHQPGRAFMRRGPGDILAFQAAQVTGVTAGGRGGRLAIEPFVLASRQPRLATAPQQDQPNDLELIVAAAGEAARRLGIRQQRLPWPEPLPRVVSDADLDAGDSSEGRIATPIGLADEPHRQRTAVAWWSADDGNLIVYGVGGSGTSTTLAALVVGLARRCAPDDLHAYVMDFDDQLLAPLVDLPHVGAVIGAGERDKQTRLLRYVLDEIARRRALAASGSLGAKALPVVLLVVDNYAGLAAAYDDPADMAIKGTVARIVADGPGVGVCVAMSAKQPADVPAQIAGQVPVKLAMRLTDRYDYTSLGVPAVEPPDAPGRAFESGSGREVQVFLPGGGDLASAVADVAHREASVRPWVIETLSSEVKIPEIVDRGRIFDLEWMIPVGMGDSDLMPAGFVLRDADHALVTGPARSGKSTALATIACVVKRARREVFVTAIAPRRSALADSPDIDVLLTEAAELERLSDVAGLHLVLVDDAESVDDAHGHIASLVARRDPAVHVVAAGSADLLRSAYGHWTSDVRRSRIGIALRPNVASDGDLFQVSLPRRGPAHFPPGRGYLIGDGATELVQVAWQ